MSLELYIYANKDPKEEISKLDSINTNSLSELDVPIAPPLITAENEVIINLEDEAGAIYNDEAYYGLDHDIKQAQKANYSLPKEYIDKVKRDNLLLADKEMYQILLDNPKLESALHTLEEFWTILKHSRGEKIYEINLYVSFFAPLETITAMTDTAHHLASKCEGIIYDTQRGEFGLVDPSLLHEDIDGFKSTLI